MFVIDNGTDGFDLHSLTTGAYVRTLPTDPTERSVPRQVAIGENGSVVIAGGNNGKVYVFHAETAATLDLLQHSHSARCQTVTVRAFATVQQTLTL